MSLGEGEREGGREDRREGEGERESGREGKEGGKRRKDGERGRERERGGRKVLKQSRILEWHTLKQCRSAVGLQNEPNCFKVGQRL